VIRLTALSFVQNRPTASNNKTIRSSFFLRYVVAPLGDWCLMFREGALVSSSNIQCSTRMLHWKEAVTLSRNVDHESPSDATPYLRRKKTSNAPPQNIAKRAV